MDQNSRKHSSSVYIQHSWHDEQFADDKSKHCMNSVSSKAISLISELLFEFLKDFKSRLSLISGKEQATQCSLEIDRDFRRSLRKDFQGISNCLLTQKFTECIEEFVKHLKKELDSIEGQSNLVLYLNEAYSTMVNASEEIGKIVAPAIKNSKAICHRMFNQHLMNHFFSQNSMKRKYISCRDQTDREKEILQSMNLDELVEYINENNGKCPRKNKKKKKSKGNSDQEIEAFRTLLDCRTMLEDRLRPNLSQTYIRSLRSKLQEKSRQNKY